jgi:hypothetical protein
LPAGKITTASLGHLLAIVEIAVGCQVLAYFRDGMRRRSRISLSVCRVGHEVFVGCLFSVCPGTTDSMERGFASSAGRIDATGRANTYTACLYEFDPDADAGVGALSRKA